MMSSNIFQLIFKWNCLKYHAVVKAFNKGIKMVLPDIQATEAKIKLLGIVDCEYLEYFRNVDCIVTNYNEAQDI